MTDTDEDLLEELVQAVDEMCSKSGVALSDEQRAGLLDRTDITADDLPSIDDILSAPTLDLAFASRGNRADGFLPLARLMFVGFMRAACDGHEFTDPNKIRARFGKTISENYPRASREFLGFATAYWTLKLLMAAWLDHPDTLVVVLANWLELNVGSVFFPTPGPTPITPEQRAAAQRLLLARSGCEAAIAPLIRGNPLFTATASRGCLSSALATTLLFTLAVGAAILAYGVSNGIHW